MARDVNRAAYEALRTNAATNGNMNANGMNMLNAWAALVADEVKAGVTPTTFGAPATAL